MRNESDFNSSYKFDVVYQGAPNALRTQEESFIDRLVTLYPSDKISFWEDVVEYSSSFM